MIAPRRFTELAAAAAAVLFLLSWAVLHTGWYDDGEIVDIPVYANYGNAIEDGAVPYRDIRPEYPPGRAARLRRACAAERRRAGVPDRLRSADGALRRRDRPAHRGALRGLRASRRRTVGALALVAAFPLLLGSVVLTRFDLYPAALVAARSPRSCTGATGSASASSARPWR